MAYDMDLGVYTDHDLLIGIAQTTLEESDDEEEE